MEVSQLALARMLLLALAIGSALGFLNDGFRTTRLWLGAQLPPAADRLTDRLALPAVFVKVMPFLKHTPRRPGRVARACLMFAEDIVLCLAGGVALILLLYATNQGQFRLSALAAMGAGIALYRFTISRLVMACSGTVTAILRSLIRWALALLLFWPVCLLRRIADAVGPGCDRLVNKLRMKLKVAREARLARVEQRKKDRLLRDERNGATGVQELPDIQEARKPMGSRGVPVFSFGRKSDYGRTERKRQDE